MTYIDDFFNDQTEARASAVANVDANPDDAARSVQLAKVNGVAPAVIDADLEAWDKTTKSDLAGAIVGSNTYLQEYIRSNPIAPKISNDDWHSLDGITRRVAGLSSGLNNTLIQTANAFLEGTGGWEFGNWMKDTPEKQAWLDSLPTWQAKLTFLGYGALGMPIEAISKVAGGLNRGGAEFAKRSYGNVTGDWNSAERFGREVGGFIEYTFNRPPGAHVVWGGAGAASQMNSQLRSIADNAGPYIRAGVEPPPFVDPVIDNLKKEQAKIDVEELGDLTKDVQQSMTRERSPEMFADLLRNQTEANIYVPWSVFERVYGEKAPRPDDNLFGWVPDIQAQMRTMSLTGGDIVIPLADWLAKSDPALAKEIRDETRIRRGGFTIEDTKMLDELAKEQTKRMGEAINVSEAFEPWHVTPHTFDTFKIDETTARTGEGAQSFGAGGYFAGNAATRDQYKLNFEGRQAPVKSQNENVARNALRNAEGDREKAIAALEDWSQQFAKGTAQYREHRAAIKMLREGYTPEQAKANVLRTRINADEELDLMQWDQELDQTPAGKKLLANMDPAFKEQLETFLDEHGQTPEIDSLTGDKFYQLLKRFASEDSLPGVKGDGTNVAKEASDWLKLNGIPGHRYLDEGSRGQMGAEYKGRSFTSDKEFLEFERKTPEDELIYSIMVGLRGQGSIEAFIKQMEERVATAGSNPAWQRIYELDKQILDYAKAHKKDFGKPKGTYNYVIFDDAIIEILDRNGEAVQALRKQAGFEPSLDVGAEKKLILGPRRGLDDLEAGLFPEEMVKDIQVLPLLDFRGKDVGNVYLSERQEGKTLFIEYMSVDRKANAYGTAALRDLFRQLKQEYPNADKVTGFRVSGAREKAGATGVAELDLRTFNDQDIKAFTDEIAPEGWTRVEPTPLEPIPDTEVISVSSNVDLFVKPTEKYTAVEKILNKAVDTLLNRVAPGAERMSAHRIANKGREVYGVSIIYADRKPFIAWAFDTPNPIGTARHEAVHYLRQNGFFTEGEWEALRSAAIEGDWIGSHRIKERYPDLKEEGWIEEAIAEQYSKVWVKEPGNVPNALKQVYEKLHKLIVEIQELVAKAWGHKPTAEELFTKIESGEVGARTGTKPIYPGAFKASEQRPTQLELDVTRQSDKAIFASARAIGMTVPQYERYLNLLKKRNAEDIQAQRERGLALEKRMQTDQWKEDSAAMEDVVRADLKDRPAVAATDFFRYGDLYGQKVEGRKPQLDSTNMTREQVDGLPPQWVKEGGMNPDDAAGMFGYHTGDEMIAQLIELEQLRGQVRPGEFYHRLVKAETERRMIAKYGELDENILKAAEDHVLGITQMDILHQETLALAAKSNSEITFTRETVQAWIDENFKTLKAKDVSVMKALDEAGRAGKAVELALLKDDVVEAFKQKQRQFFAASLAKEVKAFEKEVTKFERLADRFKSREVKGIDPEYKVHIQALLKQAEKPVRLTDAEIQEGISRAGGPHGYGTLEGLVNRSIADGYDLVVQPDIILRGTNPWDKLNVEEARDLMNAVTNLNHVGREVEKIEVMGQKKEFGEFRDLVLHNIRSLKRIPKHQNAILRFLYGWDSELVKMEEIVKDLDLREGLGPLQQVLVVPFAEAKSKEYGMMKELVEKFTALETGKKAWQKTLDKTIPQNFFLDPDGVPFDLTRSDMLGIMLNMGTRSNISKFVGGWGRDDPLGFTGKLDMLIRQNATKDDWDFVQGMWDMFGTWRRESNEMYYQLSGVPPKWIEAQPIQTPFGEYKGGYFPVNYDKYYSNAPAMDATKINPNAVFHNYHRSTPVNHYTKSRTGYVDFVEFQDAISNVPMRMQQEMHDIAYRRAIIEAKKVISDKSIRAAIRQHMGPQYEAQLTPWLQKIASQYNDSPELTTIYGLMRRARYNLVAHALGANIKIILSPDVGTFNPVALWNYFSNYKATEQLALSKSSELPHTFHNMDRDFRERLERSIGEKGLSKFQADAARWFMTPAVWVSQRFRMATWSHKYNTEMAKGASEADAVASADILVRERHGSAGIADLPAVMTQGEGMKMATMFYGFFSTTYNWQRQIPGAIRRGDMKALAGALWGAVLIPSFFGAALFNSRKEDESIIKTTAKAISMQPLATVPFLRDAAQLYFEGYNSRTPISSAVQSSYSLASDAYNYTQGKKVKKPIQHAANVVGLFTGAPLGQVGKTAQFTYDVKSGVQRPRNMLEYIRGTIHGEARLKK